MTIIYVHLSSSIQTKPHPQDSEENTEYLGDSILMAIITSYSLSVIIPHDHYSWYDKKTNYIPLLAASVIILL